MTTSPAFAANPTVAVDSVSKWFGQKVAVSDVSCSFGPGITGILGPNGAGKTTLLRMLSGLLVPSEGSIAIEGDSPRADTDVYRRFGLVPEESAVYGFLTARAFVEAAAVLSGMSDPRAAAERAIETVNLSASAEREIGEFSKGMRQRIKVAAALVHDPDILVLDEPLNGTDPVQRAQLIDTFRRLGAEGRTLIVSSHVLAEVERLADRVLAMVDGKLAAAGSVEAIRAAMSDIPFKVRVEVDDPRRLGAALMAADYVRSVTIEDGRVHLESLDLSALGHDLPRLTVDLGIRLTAVEPEDESLESVFRYLVRRR
ncbi:MAG: ABC transporter ATP-binding protein [Acidimicrobiia bacterium]|nr:ABC transporter ATP-binding protein [Acidimicrobiia bacterium]MDH3470670.1 ABC transporter ATP-binding protein [Acidimicrobiia bacterium]